MGNGKKRGEPETMPTINLSIIESNELDIEFKPEVQAELDHQAAADAAYLPQEAVHVLLGLRRLSLDQLKLQRFRSLPDSCIRLRCCPIKLKPLSVKSESCANNRHNPARRAVHDSSLNRLFIQGRENTVLNLRPSVSMHQSTSDGTSKVTSSERNPRVRTAP
jgi:hypothetical protein